MALLNGLGTFKYEELFTVFGAVAVELEAAGVDAVDSVCGELVTSLDMSGVSLTLLWVTDELAELWSAPADSPAFRTNAIDAVIDNPAVDVVDVATGAGGDAEDAAQQRAAISALDLLRTAHAAIIDGAEEFGRIDAVAGDGDHGIGMSRGVTGALVTGERVVAEGGGVVRLLAESGEAWSEHGGGTSGALWGMALASAGTSIAADRTATSTGAAGAEPDAQIVARAVAAALAGVQRLGKAEVGDKTLVDAFAPFALALTTAVDRGEPLAAAWSRAADAAQAAADATAQLEPGLGRARTHAQRSLGHPDAGAVSFARIVTAIGQSLPADRPHDTL